MSAHQEFKWNNNCQANSCLRVVDGHDDDDDDADWKTTWKYLDF